MLALVTGSANPQLCDDDQPLLAGLAEARIDVRIARWDDALVRWSEFDAVIVRSPWDYPSRPNEFVAWYERVAQASRIHNDLTLVRRNLHKRYLVELADAGVAVVPTVLIADQRDAKRVARERGWTTAVLKPAIGLGGRSVAMFTQDSALTEEPLQGTATEWCVQPYIPSIRTEGEYSVVVLLGNVQHALVKRPGPHDFRVHDGRGGTHVPHPLTSELTTLALEVVKAFDAERALFARVDLIRREDGQLAVMELDVTSPCLYTCHNGALASAFATAVMQLGAHAQTRRSLNAGLS